MSETTGTQTPAATVWPVLIYDDARAAIRFLQEAFGFVEALVVPGGEKDSRDILHAELRWPEGGGVMLASSSPDTPFGARTHTSNYVVTDKPDELFDRATRAGAEVIRELQDQDYGSREFSVRDLEGNLWSFGTYRGA